MSKRVINSPLYSRRDAAKYLNLDINVLNDLIKYGFIKVLRLGQIKVPRAQLDGFIEKWTDKDIQGALDSKRKQGHMHKLEDGEKRVAI